MDDSSLVWDDGALVTIDQRGLPHEVRELRLSTVDQVIDALEALAIRGAPAIGIAGAFGVVIATAAHTVDGVVDEAAVQAEADRIAAARPTAVNLAWAVRRVRTKVGHGAGAVLAETLDMLAEDGRVNRAAATHAADLVQRLCADRPLRVLTHCNTGRLATSAFGTAIGTLRVLAERGAIEQVLVDETRPLLQGARLTTWELAEAGIPHRLTIDSAAAWAMATGQVDCVLVGADRVTANGDVANKIGTYGLALAARHHGIPFVVVAPESTRDLSMATGREIVVEERAAAEVTGFGGVATAPEHTEVFNPAFDVTPGELVTAVVTENGVVHRGDSSHGDATTSTTPELGSDQSHGAAIADIARELYRRGWMPGTAGNISVRTGATALVTGSGLSKGELTERDMVTVRIADSAPVADHGRKPSAETTIHTAVYRTRPAQAVVHIHPPFATALATRSGSPGTLATLRITDYELIKGLGGGDPAVAEIPVFPNWPEVPRIGADIERYLLDHPGALPVLVIAGHGITAWGDDLAQARDRAECLEALCELVSRTGSPAAFAPRDDFLEIGPT
ncbi:bifunctional S-methyl-5-thioribose-1-phosphate isomerase/methylthioribulose 1-phosphate dehydratase [Nocardia gamkensis]|uniref:Methylthioribose-1-phosphate isomerase n=1 Tax=Nocardia gamkensis TaxID=352869 RepID=A0A7X6L4J6_9NOCA|nr:bifunctional S-methyl-5-thioribose-1-phosphate isomerase/methylthioribulose 1-phosphate dehydratase [Nocardia gamkensis]NKY27605.1 bifunctional S-methyl-5-thioribose-1-phosphate isomerase/methylthioribulose 1-phosphate dehydratase [Nocardia gamkensis]NQE71695.1 putative bifunctional methylthioribose-1-phosphate isomerase/methylthioribulose-1-phosphate dehydratase [Nocardia gamkensis]